MLCSLGLCLVASMGAASKALVSGCRELLGDLHLKLDPEASCCTCLLIATSIWHALNYAVAAVGLQPD